MTRPGMVTLCLLVLAISSCGEAQETSTTTAPSATAVGSTTQASAKCDPPTSTYCPDENEVEARATDPNVVNQRMADYLEGLAAGRPVAFGRITGVDSSGAEAWDGSCIFRRFEVVSPSDVAEDLLVEGGVEDTELRIGEAGEFLVLRLTDTTTTALEYAAEHSDLGVTPHYVMPMAQGYKWGPGSAPVPVDDPSIVLPDIGDRGGVVVFDVLRSNQANALPDDIDQDGYLDPVAGHGDFIASVVAGQSNSGVALVDPRASDGINDLASFDAAVRSTELSEPPYVINLSFASPPCVANGTVFEPTALKSTIDTLLEGGSLIVAAAGNDSTGLEHYPAAFAANPAYEGAIVAVGALDSQQAAAAFSNCGDWVNAWALGSHVGPYPQGNISYLPDHSVTAVSGGLGPDSSDYEWGAVAWSGTSFAAPVVTGEVAKLMMSMSTPDPRAAWDNAGLASFRPSTPPVTAGTSGHCG